jgi:outer membrane immunogenic protein
MDFRIFAFGAFVLSLAAPAMAADMTFEQSAPQPEQQNFSGFDWSGFYLGAQGGYSRNKATYLGLDQNLNSGSAGVHAGYNFQHGNIVYGIENDFNYNFEKGNEANLEWDASGRARVGYALDRNLIFATAGLAAAGGKIDVPAVGKKTIS